MGRIMYKSNETMTIDQVYNFLSSCWNLCLSKIVVNIKSKDIFHKICAGLFKINFYQKNAPKALLANWQKAYSQIIIYALKIILNVSKISRIESELWHFGVPRSDLRTYIF